MKRTSTIFLIAVLAAGVIGAVVASPALRTRVNRDAQSMLGWTEAARQADPEGFTRFVETRLRDDLQQLQETRRQLAVDTGNLVKQMHEQQKLLEQAELIAAEFRQVFQEAGDGATFPVSVRDAEYTREDVVSQVSLLLAEADGYRQSISKLEEIRSQAESRLQEIVVRVNSTESQLAAISAQRGLLRARKLSEEGEQLVAQVDQLLNANHVAIHSNPVRSVRELLASDQAVKTQPRLEVAREFLNARPSEPSKVRASEAASTKVQFLQVDKPAETLTPQPEVNDAPIFQQN